MKRFLFFSIAFAFSLCTAAQQGIFTFYSVNEGLAQSTVTCLYRDTSAYLWVGTGEGLSLFNGYEFRNFKSSINDSVSISNNRIRNFRLSADGKNIWVGTEDGINCFSRRDVHLVKKIIYPEYSGLIENPLYISDSVNWFLISSKGIFKKSKADKEPKQILSEQYQFRINPLLDQETFLYQTFQKELKSFSVRTGKSRIYPLPEGLSGKNIFNAIEMSPGKILLASETGLWILEKESGKISRYNFGDKHWDDSKKSINSVCCDASGRIWMGISEEGLFVYDPRTQKVRPVGWEQNGLFVGNKLKHIQCLKADPFGIVWAGTDGDGLVKIISDRIFFGEEYFSPLVTDTCHWFTRTFFEDNRNRLWIGTYHEGIKQIDNANGKINSFFPEFLKNGKVTSITAICAAPGNALYVGTNYGLYLWDTISGNSQRILADKNPDIACTINCLLKRKDGTVLVGTGNGLYLVNEHSGELDLDLFFQKPCYVSAVCENSEGTLIVGANYSGIYLLGKSGELRDSLVYSKSNVLPASVLVNAFIENGKDSWYASSSIGLIEFSNGLNVKKIFTDADGLPDNMLYGILRLPDQAVFISTGNGVSVFDPHTNNFENYSERDGMKSNECNTGALYFSPEKIVYVGGVNGFDFRQFPFKRKVVRNPEIYFEKQFYTGNENDSGTPFFKLDYENNTFSFQLWQTDFTFSDRTSYHYQLRGFDPKEVNAVDRRFVRYVEVNPGDYDFVGSISFPGYSSAGMLPVFSVKIIPPYWQATWFRILAGIFSLLVIASLVYFVLQSRYKKAMRRLEVQRQLERVRIRISGDIHDDIGAGLTRIALSSDLVSRQMEEHDPLKSKIRNVASSARDLSQSLKEVVWSVKPEYDLLDSMVNYFKGYCGELFEDTEIAFSFQVSGTLQAISVSPEIRRNLFLILKEACNNVMKHSGATKVEALFHYDKGKISLSVMDNGCGCIDFPKSDGMNSSGLKNMNRRATDLGFDLKISGNKGRGCSVVVSGMIRQ